MKCEICKQREATISNTLMCEPCGKSYDRQRDQDMSIAAMLIWCARRARWFERKRWRDQGPGL